MPLFLLLETDTRGCFGTCPAIFFYFYLPSTSFFSGLLLRQSPITLFDPHSRKSFTWETKISASNLESRSLIDELRSFDKGGFFDLGHPLLNRIAESIVKAAGIGAIQAVSREAYFTAVEGVDSNGGVPSEIPDGKKQNRFPGLKEEKPIENLLKPWFQTQEKNLCRLAAGLYSGLTYGLNEARGGHDWKNSGVAGAITQAWH